jgi:hypothetical protein
MLHAAVWLAGFRCRASRGSESHDCVCVGNNDYSGRHGACHPADAGSCAVGRDPRDQRRRDRDRSAAGANHSGGVGRSARIGPALAERPSSLSERTGTARWRSRPTNALDQSRPRRPVQRKNVAATP